MAQMMAPMNHEVQSVAQLGDQARSLYTNIVAGSEGNSATSAEGIRNEIASLISELQANWKGPDAAVQINNLVEVFNSLGDIGTALGEYSRVATNEAIHYNEIQIAHGAQGKAIDPVSPVALEHRSRLEDNSDQVSIRAEIANTTQKFDTLKQHLTSFKSNVANSADALFKNWSAGEGYATAKSTLDDLDANIGKFLTVVDQAVDSINTAVSNYGSRQ